MYGARGEPRRPLDLPASRPLHACAARTRCSPAAPRRDSSPSRSSSARSSRNPSNGAGSLEPRPDERPEAHRGAGPPPFLAPLGLLAALMCWQLFAGLRRLPPDLVEGSNDLGIYRAAGEAILRGEVPYLDFFVEYPPGSLPVFLPPALFSDDERRLHRPLRRGDGARPRRSRSFSPRSPRAAHARIASLGAPVRHAGRRARCCSTPSPSPATTRSSLSRWPLPSSARPAARRWHLAAYAALGFGAAAKLVPALAVLPLALDRRTAVRGSRGLFRGAGGLLRAGPAARGRRFRGELRLPRGPGPAAREPRGLDPDAARSGEQRRLRLRGLRGARQRGGPRRRPQPARDRRVAPGDRARDLEGSPQARLRGGPIPPSGRGPYTGVHARLQGALSAVHDLAPPPRPRELRGRRRAPGCASCSWPSASRRPRSSPSTTATSSTSVTRARDLLLGRNLLLALLWGLLLALPAWTAQGREREMRTKRLAWARIALLLPLLALCLGFAQDRTPSSAWTSRTVEREGRPRPEARRVRRKADGRDLRPVRCPPSDAWRVVLTEEVSGDLVA